MTFLRSWFVCCIRWVWCWSILESVVWFYVICWTKWPHSFSVNLAWWFCSCCRFLPVRPLLFKHHYRASFIIFVQLHKTTENIFAEYNQQDATFLKVIYFCKTLYMFQAVFTSIIRSTKLHIQRQAFVRPLLLPAVSLRLGEGSSAGLTNTWRCMCSFELLMMDGKPVWNM